MTATVEIGLCLPQFTADAQKVLDAARAAEADGYDAVSVFDHLRPLGGPPERPILECLTLLTAVAASTSRVRVLPLVLRAPLRPAATVGAVFRTLDLLAADRVVFGVGGGDRLNEGEDLSVGLPALTPERRRESVREVVAAVRATAPAVPVWIGGTGASMRTMAGQIADGWNAWGVSPETLQAGAVEVANAAREAGRPPPRITWGGPVSLTEDADAAAAPKAAGGVQGDAAAVAAQLQALVAAGAQSLLLSFVGAGAAAARRRFAREVLPAVRRDADLTA